MLYHSLFFAYSHDIHHHYHQTTYFTGFKTKFIYTSKITKNLCKNIFLSNRGIRTDVSLVPPIRQTASIFKQPVTVHRNQESKVKNDLKHGATQEKPKQLFWEKRLEVCWAFFSRNFICILELTPYFKMIGFACMRYGWQ